MIYSVVLICNVYMFPCEGIICSASSFMKLSQTEIEVLDLSLNLNGQQIGITMKNERDDTCCDSHVEIPIFYEEESVQEPAPDISRCPMSTTTF
jgi:hypothetical protein